ncbi:MAG TPA: sterol desaturase family protein [Candidatus Acidoferrales bacterium]|nr:sterol desaturase family protein [Candidatus Acidoferrales bacterium]
MLSSGKAWWLVFGAAFVVAALGETFWPFRDLPSSTPRRWTSNSILLAATSLVVVCVYQLSGIALACTVRLSRYAFLNRVHVSHGLRFAIGFAAVDLTAYFGHRLFHAIPPLWRIHQVHHTETDLDLTTGFRFHPIEGLVTQGLELLMIGLLGPPPSAVAGAGLVIVVQDFFTHANLRVPPTVDRFLRWLFITPAVHRVHHSELVPEQNGNFGTIFSLWDRFFGTYLAEPSMGAAQVRCGLKEWAKGSALSPAGLLILPFKLPVTENQSGRLAESTATSSVTPRAVWSDKTR